MVNVDNIYFICGAGCLPVILPRLTEPRETALTELCRTPLRTGGFATTEKIDLISAANNDSLSVLGISYFLSAIRYKNPPTKSTMLKQQKKACSDEQAKSLYATSKRLLCGARFLSVKLPQLASFMKQLWTSGALNWSPSAQEDSPQF